MVNSSEDKQVYQANKFLLELIIRQILKETHEQEESIDLKELLAQMKLEYVSGEGRVQDNTIRKFYNLQFYYILREIQGHLDRTNISQFQKLSQHLN